jgi:hypothetical protein
VALLVRKPFSMSIEAIQQLTSFQVEMILNNEYVRRLEEERYRQVKSGRK